MAGIEIFKKVQALCGGSDPIAFTLIHMGKITEDEFVTWRKIKSMLP